MADIVLLGLAYTADCIDFFMYQIATALNEHTADCMSAERAACDTVLQIARHLQTSSQSSRVWYVYVQM